MKAAFPLRSLAVFLTAAAIAGTAAADVPRKIPMDNIGVKFLTLLGEGKATEAFEKYVGPTYIQHAPIFPDGKEATVKMLNAAPPGMRFKHEFYRVLVDGDLIAIHSKMTSGPNDRGLATIDILRTEKGKIVEHWDVVQPVPEKAANNNTMF